MVLILLLACSLNFDALGVGLSYGMRGVRIPRGSLALLSVCSVVYALLASVFGGVLTGVLPTWVSRWPGALILLTIAVFALLRALRDPPDCDFDASQSIDLREALALSLALSLDSFGATLSLALDTGAGFVLPLLIGACQLTFLLFGEYLGHRLAKTQHFPARALNFAAGLLLLVLAVLRIL